MEKSVQLDLILQNHEQQQDTGKHKHTYV
jgi:hypothetical protein